MELCPSVGTVLSNYLVEIGGDTKLCKHEEHGEHPGYFQGNKDHTL